MANTFNDIWRTLTLYNADIPPRLIQDWVQEAWTKVCDAKLWSWGVEEGQFETIASVSTGDLTVTSGSATVTATTSPFTTAMVGQQIKINNQIFTIDSRADANNVDLDRNWGFVTGTQTGTVLTAYVSMPTNFYGFVSVIDTQAGRRLWTNIDMKMLDHADPQRTSSAGSPSVLADRKWKTSPSSATTVPMYELWPHATTERAYRMLYWKVPAAFSRTVALPYTISDRIIKNYARAMMSGWPGTNKNPNRMQSRTAKADYLQEFRDDLQDLMIKDDEIFDTDVWTDTKMIDLVGPVRRTEAGPFPSLGYHF